jgi:hypothetical protein
MAGVLVAAALLASQRSAGRWSSIARRARNRGEPSGRGLRFVAAAERRPLKPRHLEYLAT